MRAARIQGIEAAVAKLKKDPDHPVMAEIDGVVIEMRYKGRHVATEGRALLDALNRVHGDVAPDSEAATLREAMRDKQRRLVTGEW